MASVSPACDERVNAARKVATEFIDVSGHVVIMSVTLVRANLFASGRRRANAARREASASASPACAPPLSGAVPPPLRCSPAPSPFAPPSGDGVQEKGLSVRPPGDPVLLVYRR